MEHEEIEMKQKAQIELKNLLRLQGYKSASRMYRTEAVRIHTIISSYK